MTGLALRERSIYKPASNGTAPTDCKTSDRLVKRGRFHEGFQGPSLGDSLMVDWRSKAENLPQAPENHQLLFYSHPADIAGTNLYAPRTSGRIVKRIARLFAASEVSK